MRKDISINTEQGLYVIPCGSGYTCLGFEVADRKARDVAEWMGRDDLIPQACNPPGTLGHYDHYSIVMSAGAEYSHTTGKRCPAELTKQLIGLEGARVEVIDKDGTKRRFYVGKSTGWMPIHLEIARCDSTGGTAVYGAPFKWLRVIRRKGAP